MDLWLTTFAAGAGIGLAVAMPVGPMGVLCIQRTLSSGFVAGLTTGIGAATVHLLFGALVALGLGAAATASVGAGSRSFAFVSAGLLFWFAARILRRQIALDRPVNPYRGWVASYTSAFVFGLANPLTIVLFAAAFPALASGPDRSVPLLVSGVFAGSTAWWIVLSLVVASVRHRLPARALAATNLIAGVTLAGLGITMGASALGLSFP